MDYNEWPQEAGDALHKHIPVERYVKKPFTRWLLTPEERVELQLLQFKDSITSLDIELRIKDESYKLASSLLIQESRVLISESEKLEPLRVERHSRNYHELCLDIKYLHTLHAHELSLIEESSSLLETSYLGDEIDINTILDEIDNPTDEMNYTEETIVHYAVDGDDVDYFFMDSFEHEVDFIFPSNAFNPPVHSKIQEAFRLITTFVVHVLDYNFSSFTWTIVSLFAQFVPCLSRRRTKGRLAQPFDSHD